MASEIQSPKQKSYDVVIVGGAMYGSSVAWWTARNPDFDGSILVVERDPTYEFTVNFTHQLLSFFDNDDRVPEIVLQSYGYMYLADNDEFAQTLKESQEIQQKLGSGTKHMSAAEIKEAYPFYNMDDILVGNHNLIDEGYFDGNTIFDWWKRSAREHGAEYIHNEVTAMGMNGDGTKVDTVTLQSGDVVSCGKIVNCAGPRAVVVSRMAGIEIPVEPRKRYTYIFDAEQPLDRDLPLTIDPTGVHMRTDEDIAPDYDDFEQDHSLWEQHVWPIIATRVPQFEAIKLINSWAGHYAFNTLDQNAIIGPHSKVENFIFVNGFSGHGFQQSPAMGRGVSEFITYGEYRTIDLSAFGYERIEKGEKFVEKAVI
ncbi:FAD-dependent oxidoreductase domain-containing protein 1 [Nymphon striatum]|nr:FAD-dependent oxidoreductase domain-containing protein 1 [Nymphon striatum]